MYLHICIQLLNQLLIHYPTSLYPLHISNKAMAKALSEAQLESFQIQHIPVQTPEKERQEKDSDIVSP